MFDSVKMYLPARRENEFADVHKRLENCERHEDGHSAELKSYTGTIGGADGNNLRICITHACLWLENSLWKYAKGNNLVPFSRNETADAIEGISQTLGIDIANANVSRLDAAVNVPLSHAPPEYFCLLSHSPRYKKMRTYPPAYDCNGDKAAPPRTVNAEMKQRSWQWYDKTNEMQSKGVTIPAEYAGKHVARFELKYLEKTTRQLRRKVFASNLTETGFRILILQNLKNEYSQIKKANSMKNYNNIPFKTQRELSNDVGMRSLVWNLGGAAAAEAWLREKQKEYGFNRTELMRMIRRVRALYAHENADGDNALVHELDSAMAGAIAAVSEDNAAAN